MSTQYNFKRYEIKYRISLQQMEYLLALLEPEMQADAFGLHKINNLYYDTENYELIRRSLEKPVYKEKFRLRWYNDTPKVFAEIKKKYKGIVYKRRVAAPEEELLQFLAGQTQLADNLQNQAEILHFFTRYPISPKAYVGYDRLALAGRKDPELRVTFDRNLVWSTEHLLPHGCRQEQPILPPDQVIMEIKIHDAMPFWLARLLSEQGIFASSFSKYGTYYKNEVLPAVSPAAITGEDLCTEELPAGLAAEGYLL